MNRRTALKGLLGLPLVALGVTVKGEEKGLEGEYESEEEYYASLGFDSEEEENCRKLNDLFREVYSKPIEDNLKRHT